MIIKLAELISPFKKHTICNEDEENLVPVDNWKATDCMYLEDMGWKNDGIFYYALKKPPMKLSYKKGVGFVVDDVTKKEKKTFQKFSELENFFSNYKQKWENTPYENYGGM